MSRGRADPLLEDTHEPFLGSIEEFVDMAGIANRDHLSSMTGRAMQLHTHGLQG